LRNIAVALGNGPSSKAAIEILESRSNDTYVLVREHVHWALERLRAQSTIT